MALSDDQRAMLQLMLERGQSYEDIASLLGVGEDEVRSRARDALAELGGSDPDAEVGLTDYLLGQADPIGRADAVRHLQDDPEALDLASSLETKLRVIAPEAEMPQLPGRGGRRGPRRRRERAAAAPAAEKGGRPRLRGDGEGMSPSQIRLIVVFGLVGVLLIAAVAAIAGGFSSSSDSGGSTSASDTTASTTANSASGPSKVLATIPLKGQGGSDASGKAIFGIAGGSQPYLEASLKNLQPAPAGRTYVLWLLLTPTQGYPLSPLQIPDSGNFDDRFPIPQFATQLAARTRFVDISLTDNANLQKQLPKAVKQGNPILTYSGESIARGAVPKTASTAQGGAAGGGAGGGGTSP